MEILFVQLIQKELKVDKLISFSRSLMHFNGYIRKIENYSHGILIQNLPIYMKLLKE